MKIAITSQNFRTVTGHAGRARRFLIYDAEPGCEPIEVARLDLPKELAMHDVHGGGPHPIDGVDVILSQGFGAGFARRMARRGITASATDEADPVEAVKTYLADQQTAPEGFAAASCGCGHRHAHRHHHGHDATAELHVAEITEGEKRHEWQNRHRRGQRIEDRCADRDRLVR